MAVLLSFVVCALFAISSIFGADAEQVPFLVDDGKLDLIYEYELQAHEKAIVSNGKLGSRRRRSYLLSLIASRRS